VTLKPLSSNVSNTEVSMVAALQPHIDARIKFFFGSLSFGGGPYISLPTVTMNVTQMTTESVGANCEASGDTDVRFTDAYENLMHVDYSLGIDAGLHMGIDLIGIEAVEFSVPVWSTTLLAATQCFAYQTTGSTTGLAYATDVLMSMTHTPKPSTDAGKTSHAMHKFPRLSDDPWLAALAFAPMLVTLLL
jgi:hypothetical protein